MTHSNNGIKRVIFVSNIVGRIGGLSSVVNTLATAFEKRGIKVEHLSKGIPEETLAPPAGQKVTQLDIHREKTTHNPLAKEHKGPLGLKYLVKSLYTVIWDIQFKKKLHNTFSDFTSEDLLIIVDPYAGQLVLPALKELNRKPNRPLIVTEFHSRFGSNYQKAVDSFYPEVIKNSDYFISLTTEDAQNFSEYYGVETLAISNPVKPNVYNPDFKTSRSLVVITRLDGEKNVDRIIKSFDSLRSEYPQWTLAIYGFGPEQEKIESLIKELANPAIHFNGSVTQPEAQEILAHADLGMMASEFEGIPMFLLEAMASGTPIISSPASPAIVELVGEYGYLATSNSIEDLAEQLRIALSDRALREEKARASYEKSKEFSPDAIAQIWLDLKR